jgi:LmbE family N-acetylglucosaminyl deacetylase
MNPLPDYLYLSPHLDDAVLSCGGTIHRQVQAGKRVVVATFFTATPTNPAFTPHTRELLARWDRGGDPLAVRRGEDLEALSMLDAEALHLPFLDCVYRTSADGAALYPEKDDIFGPLHPQEEGLAHVLLEGLLNAVPLSPEVVILAPLGAGRHVDHLLVRSVAIALDRRAGELQGERVRFYEDYPYAGDGDAVRRGMAPWSPSCWQAAPQALEEVDVAAKAHAAACYASQISTFWADAVEMHDALTGYARRVAAKHPPMTLAENYWMLDRGCIKEKNEPS